MSNPPESWKELVDARFGDAQSALRLRIWERGRHRYSEGDIVEGVVAARAPFGLWVELPLGVPGLLLWPDAAGISPRAFEHDHVLPVGDTVRGRVVVINDHDHVIRLAQIEHVYAKVAPCERERLMALTTGCSSVDDVLAHLGTPDEDHPRGVFVAKKRSGRWCRVLVYRRLSESAVLRVCDMAPEAPHADVWPKYLGERTLLEADGAPDAR